MVVFVGLCIATVFILFCSFRIIVKLLTKY
jgi:hypothetical protein